MMGVYGFAIVALNLFAIVNWYRERSTLIRKRPKK